MGNERDEVTGHLEETLPHRYGVVIYDPETGFDEKADWPTLGEATAALHGELRRRAPSQTRGVGMLADAGGNAGGRVYDRLVGKWTPHTGYGYFPMELEVATDADVRAAAADVLMHLTGASAPDFDSLMDLIATNEGEIVESMVDGNPDMATSSLRDMYGEALRRLEHDVRDWHREGESLSRWAAREGKVVDPCELECSWPGAFDTRIRLGSTGVPTFAGLMSYLEDSEEALARDLVEANPQLSPTEANQVREAYGVAFEGAIEDVRVAVALGCLSLEGMATSELCRGAERAPEREAGREK